MIGVLVMKKLSFKSARNLRSSFSVFQASRVYRVTRETLGVCDVQFLPNLVRSLRVNSSFGVASGRC